MKTTNQNTSFHIHEVLNALYQDSTPRTLPELNSFIAEKFGTNPQFFSCSEQNMSIDQAIEFMMMREKISEVSEGKFAIHTGNQCNH